MGTGRLRTPLQGRRRTSPGPIFVIVHSITPGTAPGRNSAYRARGRTSPNTRHLMASLDPSPSFLSTPDLGPSSTFYRAAGPGLSSHPTRPPPPPGLQSRSRRARPSYGWDDPSSDRKEVSVSSPDPWGVNQVRLLRSPRPSGPSRAFSDGKTGDDGVTPSRVSFTSRPRPSSPSSSPFSSLSSPTHGSTRDSSWKVRRDPPGTVTVQSPVTLLPFHRPSSTTPPPPVLHVLSCVPTPRGLSGYPRGLGPGTISPWSGSTP